MSPAQATGSASSYAGKYALGNLLCLDDTQDDDAIQASQNTTKQTTKKTTKAQDNLTTIKSAFNEIVKEYCAFADDDYQEHVKSIMNSDDYKSNKDNIKWYQQQIAGYSEMIKQLKGE